MQIEMKVTKQAETAVTEEKEQTQSNITDNKETASNETPNKSNEAGAVQESLPTEKEQSNQIF
jgi:hypothetical protein